MPKSIGAPLASRNVVAVAVRGKSVLPAMLSIKPPMSDPDTRTIPMPARPGGVAMAAIVRGATDSFITPAVYPTASTPLRCDEGRFPFEYAIHVPLLEDLD